MTPPRWPSPRTRRGGEPAPEAPGHARGDQKLVGRRLVDLPELHADVGYYRERSIVATKGAWVEVDRAALGERLARSRAGDAQDRAPVALVGHRRETPQLVDEPSRHGAVRRPGKPLLRACPHEV